MILDRLNHWRDIEDAEVPHEPVIVRVMEKNLFQEGTDNVRVENEVMIVLRVNLVDFFFQLFPDSVLKIAVIWMLGQKVAGRF